MTALTIDISGLIQSQVAKLTGKMDGVMTIAERLKPMSASLPPFNLELNKNFPQRDALIAQFDQGLTSAAAEFKNHMIETRAKLPKPKPPIKPVVAIWPGVQGGSKGV